MPPVIVLVFLMRLSTVTALAALGVLSHESLFCSSRSMNSFAKVGRTGTQAVFITRLRSIALGCTTALLLCPGEESNLARSAKLALSCTVAGLPLFRLFGAFRGCVNENVKKTSDVHYVGLHPLGHAAACLSSISLALAPRISAYCLAPSRQWQSEDKPSPSHAPRLPRPLHAPAPWATGTRKSSAKRE